MTIQSVEVIPWAASKSTFCFGTSDRLTSPNVVVISLSDAGAVGVAWPMLPFISQGSGSSGREPRYRNSKPNRTSHGRRDTVAYSQQEENLTVSCD
jgi:hypothetical protein